MARLTPQKRHLLDALADEFLHNYAQGRSLLAVDGPDGVGRDEFADALAERLRRRGHSASRASIDGFQRSRAERHAKGADSAEGHYTDTYDYALFRRVLVEPFRLGGSAGFVTAAWDVARDAPVEMAWQTAPRDATLVVDGRCLNRPELSGLWTYSLWLEPHGDALGAQALYLAEADPRARASAIVDNADVDDPQRVFADSC
ncbi:MAG: uridine kinase [Rhodoglobus sp.]